MAKKNDEMTDTVCDSQVKYMVFGLIGAIGELNLLYRCHLINIKMCERGSRSSQTAENHTRLHIKKMLLA